ncbi:hypothetical protein B0H13DRAFT_1893571 [Mycena leptocephala]|nr:hypothetical protein B0H13DRAFT_1893571 [Mycena leptocephala]
MAVRANPMAVLGHGLAQNSNFCAESRRKGEQLSELSFPGPQFAAVRRIWLYVQIQVCGGHTTVPIVAVLGHGLAENSNFWAESRRKGEQLSELGFPGPQFTAVRRIWLYVQIQPYMPYRTPYAAVFLTGITVYGVYLPVGRDGTAAVKPSYTASARSPRRLPEHGNNPPKCHPKNHSPRKPSLQASGYSGNKWSTKKIAHFHWQVKISGLYAHNKLTHSFPPVILEFLDQGVAWDVLVEPNGPTGVPVNTVLRLPTRRRIQKSDSTQNCNCPTNCINRVAQRPRQIPIEIFKTGQRGWGCRTSDVLVRGQVLGLYTSLREKAHKLIGTRGSYLFELDIDEEPDDSPRDAYSVDSFHCGKTSARNQHMPRSRTVFRQLDPIHENNTPYYLAFVATENICPGTELTLDYSPAERSTWEMKKYEEKSRSKRLKNKKQPRCLCGTKECRGWLSVVA